MMLDTVLKIPGIVFTAINTIVEVVGTLDKLKESIKKATTPSMVRVAFLIQ